MESMPTAEELDRVCVVLVRARNPNNIGAVARAMHNFGFNWLRVVNDFQAPLEAARSAVDASEVMQSAAVFATVAEAVADCTVVVGTTAVGERDLQHELLALAQAAPRMRTELRRSESAAEAATGRVALLFGSEKTGLSNEELSHCNWLLTIPMSLHLGVRHPSMNLGQAVAVCLYELVRDEDSPPHAENTQAHADAAERMTPLPANGVANRPASAGELERLTLVLVEVLEKTGYTRHHPANSYAAHVRRLVRRMGGDVLDTRVWMGVLRQVLWKLGRAD
jgi:TrmH family RNA methyltransferase